MIDVAGWVVPREGQLHKGGLCFHLALLPFLHPFLLQVFRMGGSGGGRVGVADPAKTAGATTATAAAAVTAAAVTAAAAAAVIGGKKRKFRKRKGGWQKRGRGRRRAGRVRGGKLAAEGMG